MNPPAAAAPDSPTPTHPAFDPRTITGPAPVLMNYYLVVALLTLFAFPVTIIALYLRFRTLRYRFDDDGVWMSVGLLFKKEVNLAYRRIQDIHLTRNVIQRWFGLATLSVQTASGSAAAEMTIEGVLEADALRDYLYTRMRGSRGIAEPAPVHPAGAPTDAAAAAAPSPSDQALVLLREIRDEIRAMNERQGAQP